MRPSNKNPRAKSFDVHWPKTLRGQFVRMIPYNEMDKKVPSRIRSTEITIYLN